MREVGAVWALVLVFMLQSHRVFVASITDPVDVEAMIQFKAAIDPATICAGSCLASWNFSLDPCDNKFREVFTCGFDCEQEDILGLKHVTSLQLQDSGYGGMLSRSIGNLSALKFLRLSGNSLTGGIPDTLGKLSQLMMLDLSSNNFIGRVPESFGSMGSLQSLNFANNLLNGTIPSCLSKLTSLTELRLESNYFDGALPDLSGLEQLQLFDASDNRFSGSIPRRLPPSLYSLSLKNNLLTGRMPNSIARLQQLNVLDVSGNGLTGPVNDVLLAHPSVQQLNLSNNRLTGFNVRPKVVPKSQMIAIDLSYNLISGPLPGYFASMKQLSSLSLRYNFFHGLIPQQYALKAVSALAGMEPLERLMLDGNFLTGPLPAPFMTLHPDSVAASFVDNCLQSCPSQLFFCQGGKQKTDSVCRLFNPEP